MFSFRRSLPGHRFSWVTPGPGSPLIQPSAVDTSRSLFLCVSGHGRGRVRVLGGRPRLGTLVGSARDSLTCPPGHWTRPRPDPGGPKRVHTKPGRRHKSTPAPSLGV